MPFIAGIAFSGLTTGSPIFIQLLSSDNPSFSLSCSTTFRNNLQETANEIAASFPEKPVIIKLALPSFVDNPTRRPILQAFKQAGLVFPILSENLQLGHNLLITQDHDPRNEILFHLAPTLAISRLVSTTVEEQIRDSTTLNEYTIDSPSSDTRDIITQFINTAQATLDQQPSDAGSKLEHIVVIEASITTTQTTHSIWRQGDAAPIKLTKIGFPSVALHAAQRTLSSYNQDTSDFTCAGMPILSPVRIGIVKADGFVYTLVPRHAVLPQKRFATFTTFKDDQTNVAISLVVGESPRGKENVSVARLALHDLPARPAGVLAIRVTIDVGPECDILVMAEEAESGVSETISSMKLLGEHHHWDEVEEVLEKFKLGSSDEEAERAEKEWAGKDKQGALSE